MQEITITFKNNTTKNFPINTSIYEIAEFYQKECKMDILGARINNEIANMDTKVDKNCKIDFLDLNDPYGYRMYRAALKFIFCVATKEIFPNIEIDFLHSVPKGMVAEVKGSINVIKDDITKIKEQMYKIIKANEPIQKVNILKKEAFKYFQNTNQEEKAKNIHNTNKEIVSLYKLKNIYNYFYTEMPCETKKINKFNLIYLGKNKIVIVYPSVRTDGLLPEYVHYDSIIDTFEDRGNWLKMMDVIYLSHVNDLISNNKIESFIKASELAFNDHISQISKTIKNNQEIKVVLISGPSSSGKTTTTKRLSNYLETLGYNPIPISVDDYYKDEIDMKKDKVKNYEVLESIDLKMFNDDINKLIKGEEVHLPTYSFINKKKIRNAKSVKMGKKGILLVEGLHCLNDELTINIENKYKYKIYLSPFISLRIDRHNFVSTVDLRLIRRIVRDNRTRDTNVSDTIKMWQEVREGEEKYIFPYIHQADTVINTAYAFEIGVLKVYAEPLLFSVGIDSPFYEEARRLINFMQEFYAISSEYVSRDSILREFIG